MNYKGLTYDHILHIDRVINRLSLTLNIVATAVLAAGFWFSYYSYGWRGLFLVPACLVLALVMIWVLGIYERLYEKSIRKGILSEAALHVSDQALALLVKERAEHYRASHPGFVQAEARREPEETNAAAEAESGKVEPP